MIKKILFVIFSLLIISMLIYVFTNSKSEYDFKIHFFNAGKADAILISKNNSYMMIDTGEDSLSDEILLYFKENEIRKLDYLIITHFDKDHVGGASKIIDNIPIDRVLTSKSKKDSIYYSNYITSMDNRGIIPLIITDDYEFRMSSIMINVNGTDREYDKNESNNSSLIVGIEYDNNSFLFMGDAENARIKDFVSFNKNEYDFLKIPYHGNYLKRLDDLLDSTNPKYAVITSSYEDEKTTDLLEKYDLEYYNTMNGSIDVLSNGSDIKIIQG